MRDTTSFTWSVVPGNSAVVVPFDSTWCPNCATGSIATTSAYLVPGPNRAIWEGACLRYTVLCTVQNVTVLEQVLTGVALAATDWETQGTAGTHTITAGTTFTGEFKPLGSDWRIRIDAGATGPTVLVVHGTITRGEDYGG